MDKEYMRNYYRRMYENPCDLVIIDTEEFEEKKKDAKFANDPQAILNFFYEKVKKSAHQNNELHPAWRVMEK
mgnify:CR=1 FL=1